MNRPIPTAYMGKRKLRKDRFPPPPPWWWPYRGPKLGVDLSESTDACGGEAIGRKRVRSGGPNSSLLTRVTGFDKPNSCRNRGRNILGVRMPKQTIMTERTNHGLVTKPIKLGSSAAVFFFLAMFSLQNHAAIQVKKTNKKYLFFWNNYRNSIVELGIMHTSMKFMRLLPKL